MVTQCAGTDFTSRYRGRQHGAAAILRQVGGRTNHREKEFRRRSHDGVWSATRRPRPSHQARCPGGPHASTTGRVVAPLRSGRLARGHCLFYATPGQMNLFHNGLHITAIQRDDLLHRRKRLRDAWGGRGHAQTRCRACFASAGTVRGRRRAVMACPPDDSCAPSTAWAIRAKKGPALSFPPMAR